MSFLEKLAIWSKRTFNSKSLDFPSEEKRYGNSAENMIIKRIKFCFPNAIIKTNVMLKTLDGNSEIDCVVLIDDRLFIIEVKHWLGTIIEKDGYFITYKSDKYLNEIHEKQLKSPFSQVKRQIRLLKEMTSSNPWVNSIVFFCDASNVICSNDNVWFDDLDSLISYLQCEGVKSNYRELNKCISNLKSSDILISYSFFRNKHLHCLIDDDFFNFTMNNDVIRRKDIANIKINHHLTYDELIVNLKNGKQKIFKNDCSNIKVFDGKQWIEYSLSKLNEIILGE